MSTSEDINLLDNHVVESDALLSSSSASSSWRKRCSIAQRQKGTLIGVGTLSFIAIVTIVTLSLNHHNNNGNDNNNDNQMMIDAFQASIVPSSVLSYLHYFTSAAHIAGSERGYETAVYIRDEWLKAGLSRVEIEEFLVLLSYPVHRSVNLLQPTPYTCKLHEAVVPVDPTSSEPIVPTFLAYSASGTVTAPVIYVNYCRQEDFDLLVKVGGVGFLHGRIALCRYGEVFRGDKVVLAQEHGMAGVLIYSDPADDGYGRGKIYPDGPWRPPTGVQRGTIFTGHGDPLTPAGVPSVPNAPRLTIDQAHQANATAFPLPRIPAMCLSYEDAEPILRALSGGMVLPRPDWQGGIRDLNYSVGPGASSLQLSVEMNTTRTTIYNVVGDVIGRQDDRYVLIGNHRDAWGFGGGDPSSGTAVLMTIAKALGTAAKSASWKPERTIRLCSWDAEEYALVGSTEHVEKRSVAYSHQVIAYLNTDVALSGAPSLSIGGMPVLTDLVRDVARTIAAPASASPYKNLLELWSLSQPMVSPVDNLPVLEASNLGEGSDYGPFVQYLGVPVIDFSFGSESNGYEGVYHSAYDSYYWITHFSDPAGDYGACLARLIGTIALRLSSDRTLPLRFRFLPNVLQSAAQSIETKAPSGKLHLQPLTDAIISLATTINIQDQKMVAQDDRSMSELQRRVYDDRLMVSTRGCLFLPGGRSPWYRNVIWTTALYDGYSSGAFSLIGDELSIGQYDQAQHYVQLIAVVLDQMNILIQNIL